jgi:hypothetical protein
MPDTEPINPTPLIQQQLMPGMPGIYEVAGTALEELVDNKPALKVVLHAFRQAVDENMSLKQQQSFDKAEISPFHFQFRISGIFLTVCFDANGS